MEDGVEEKEDETNTTTNGDSTADHSADRTPPAESQNLSTAARANGMTISLDGISSSIDPSKAFSRAYGSMKAASFASHPSNSSSAPPTAHAHCPTCGKTVSDPLILPFYSSSSSASSPDVPLGSSPLVIPMGPLAAAAFESGMSAVEELKLLKAQVQDVARVYNAVARGDLSQKITVPVQGVVMVQLKDVINTMFAKEVTRVSQEVGTEGYSFFSCYLHFVLSLLASHHTRSFASSHCFLFYASFYVPLLPSPALMINS